MVPIDTIIDLRLGIEGIYIPLIEQFDWPIQIVMLVYVRTYIIIAF